MTAGGRASAAAVAAVLVAAIALVYGQTLSHEFVNFDDPVFFTENPALEEGLSIDGVAWAFTSMRAANWFPATRLSLLFDAELHGASSAGVHLTNLILHAGSAVLLFLALLRMTGGLAASAFVAAVFALHPLQVESVAWASERKGVLAGFFWMATLFVYAGAGSRPLTVGRGCAVLALLCCGLASKLVLATLPAVLLLLDYWPLRRLSAPGSPDDGIDLPKLRRALLEKLPMGIAVVGAAALVFEAQSRGGAVASLEQVPWDARLANATVAYARYVGLFFWPRELAVLHPHPGSTLPIWQVGLAGTFLAGTTVVALLTRRERPALAIGWLWFLGTLVPMIGVVHLGSQALAERYAYVPLVGLAIALTWGLMARGTVPTAVRWVRASVALAVLAVLGGVSHGQVAQWRDSETLFRHTLAVTEGNAVAHSQLGHALLEAHRDAEALASYREALEVDPTNVGSLNNLAWLLATHPDSELRDAEAAMRFGREAVRLTGAAAPSPLDTLAAAYAEAERFDLAVLTGAKALQLAGQNEPELAAAIRARLALYRAERAYREQPVAPGHPFDSDE